jgi:hypothetical protein
MDQTPSPNVQNLQTGDQREQTRIKLPWFWQGTYSDRHKPGNLLDLDPNQVQGGAGHYPVIQGPIIQAPGRLVTGPLRRLLFHVAAT